MPSLPVVKINEMKCDDCILETVNCVRWSPANGGRYLATGGDDALITVYECVGRGISAGTIGQANSKGSAYERYRCVARLYGHEMDVLHFEWSTDGR